MIAPELQPTIDQLRGSAGRWTTVADWPAESLALCGRAGVYEMLTGSGSRAPLPPAAQLELLIELATADLLTTFVITQHLGAIKRIAASDLLADHRVDSNDLTDVVLPRLISGRCIASVGISHLTTSRLHLAKPAVQATAVESGYRLSGTVPWVTGAPHVEWIVVGATCEDGSQLLALIAPPADGIQVGQGADMIAMSASCTDMVNLDDVFVPESRILTGPRDNVLQVASADTTKPSGAGGLQTSALALGLSSAALDYLKTQSQQRPELSPVVDRFESEHRSLRSSLLSAAAGETSAEPATIRGTANRLVQRTTSAAMTAAKGAGLLSDHPVGRWCGQSFFFLVWSCPQPVADAHLCELAGIESE